ncbi:AI-2E family transporter [Aurantimonas sp. VKM B-3413]|uniref:AI-2E family transporter n=1 Tax=Aurantimonas sp. VKM B-3413 TaxID=2779401 RepID=UPI001E3F4984|nr:AI-2E family transporter [Aurantimonas sp. VKM B-3413]MCB8836804.1 AI-2E family transporter [Aurantimonas sp. VKM B-3413]
MSRRIVSVLVLTSVAILVLWLAPDVLLAVFAGVLLAVFLRGGGDWTAKHVGAGRNIGLTVFSVVLLTAIVAFLAIAGAALADQVQKLIDSFPEALQGARGYVDEHGWLRRLLDLVDAGKLLPSGSGATTAFSATFGALGNAVVIVFVGLYGAISPGIYVRGATRLLAPTLRPKAAKILSEAGVALRGWLKAQFVSMTVVGVLTGLGLWALDVPLALVLAVIAAILTFVPNIGPVLAAVPAVLLGLSEGVSTALWIVALYVAIQTVESYVITPRVQEEAVSLPPALTISVQLLFGVLFGVLGLALATPIAAVLLRVGEKFYVRSYLDQES